MSSVDLCAGPGGWEVAAADLGLDDVVGVELDGQAAAIRDAAGFQTVQADVSLLDPSVFAPAEGLIGSPPCPTYSLGSGAPAVRNLEVVLNLLEGLANGVDRRDALRYIDLRDVLVVEPLRWALDLRPRWIALEQVPAVMPVWHATAAALEREGYRTWTGLLNAADYGAPQDRGRAILMAHVDTQPGIPQPLERIAPTSVLRHWSDEDVVGFPRRADRGAAIELNGERYRARDLRPADRPVYTLTSKSRSWVRITPGGRRHRLELAEAIALQGFPPDFPFAAAGSRSAAFEHLANTIAPPLARAILAELTTPGGHA